VFDVETTGLDVKTARIIELGFQRWTPEGMDKEWRSLINPGVIISAEAEKVHHISNEQLHKCRVCGKNPVDVTARMDDFCSCESFKPWPTFAQIAPNLAKGFTDVDFAGKNIRYDLRILATEFGRVQVLWSYSKARIIDADRLEQLGEPRTLSNLYKKHLGREPVDAHQALADVRMTAEVIEAQLQKYQTLPRDLDILHATQWPGWIDPDGKFRFVDGVPCFTQWGKFKMQPMKNADKGYWKFILANDFSADVKALAQQALMGKFPTP